jgi:hypothetical protein
MLETIIAAVLNTLIDKFFDLAIPIFKNIAIKRGITLEAKKNEEHINTGNAALNHGKINDWLNSLNKEN